MITNASPLEWLWTLLALGGVGMGAVAVWAAILDASVAFRPPPGLLTTLQERALGAWLAVKWAGITVCHVCNLIIGWRAMLVPAPPTGDATRQDSAIITGLCLIAVEAILVGLTFGQLYTRWLVLKLQAGEIRAARQRRPPVRLHEKGETDV